MIIIALIVVPDAIRVKPATCSSRRLLAPTSSSMTRSILTKVAPHSVRFTHSRAWDLAPLRVLELKTYFEIAPSASATVAMYLLILIVTHSLIG